MAVIGKIIRSFWPAEDRDGKTGGMMLVLRFASSKVIDPHPGICRKMGVGEACRWVESGMRLRPVMPDATIHAVAKILENLNPVLYRAALPNGKVILAHLSKPLTEAKAVFSADECVVVELTAFDFDNARILRGA